MASSLSWWRAVQGLQSEAAIQVAVPPLPVHRASQQAQGQPRRHSLVTQMCSVRQLGRRAASSDPAEQESSGCGRVCSRKRFPDTRRFTARNAFQRRLHKTPAQEEIIEGFRTRGDQNGGAFLLALKTHRNRSRNKCDKGRLSAHQDREDQASLYGREGHLPRPGCSHGHRAHSSSRRQTGDHQPADNGMVQLGASGAVQQRSLGSNHRKHTPENRHPGSVADK